MHERKRRDMETAEALLAWSAGLDRELSRAGAVSTDNRKTALAMIEAAFAEADTVQPRGGHRHGARRALMPWELEREAHVRELIEAAVRGHSTRRTGELAHVRSRLEYLRGELREERISYGELYELQGYGDGGFILPDDVELREAAGLPEFEVA